MSTTISEIMTRNVTVVAPDDDLQRAAQMMRDWNVGALPVCDGRKLRGMITDRDITIRATADGRAPHDCRVAEVMSPEVRWCFEDQTVGEVLQEMGDEQVRRIPVVSRDMELVGMVSLGDVATRDNMNVDPTLEEISAPGVPNKASADEMRLRRPPSDQADGRF
ncbi:MAG TPA: CBS domain-containing protein [Noviherbaspirillum sp.]|jgi:CBS domain-containing protein|uniref:CBS domain-containing protein n=1 Tax=Noviherbaspirillum sp. TaxID=1926288 RepID=UPI002F94F4AC